MTKSQKRKASRTLVWICWMCVSSLTCFAQDSNTASQLRLDNSNPESPSIYAGNQLITQYLPESNTKPVFFPLQTVSGNRLVRNYPLVEGPDFEKQDHPHHRSFWFTFGSINGVDYWSEQAEDKQGYVVSTNLTTKEEGGDIVLESEWEWQGPDREVQANSSQSLRFQLQDGIVHMDTSIRLNATHGDLQFGDTKEGAFAVRVGELMKMDAKKGGQIVNDRSYQGEATWGKSARWVQYSGPSQRNDEPVEDPSTLPTAGITMLVHPSSFGYPGRWHVRTYGLFAHNPFGIHDFLPSQPLLDDQEKARQGGFTLKAGEEVFLRYLVLLHDGTLEPKRIESIWEDFANR